MIASGVEKRKDKRAMNPLGPNHEPFSPAISNLKKDMRYTIAEIISDFSDRPRKIQPKYFSYGVGSELFERICETPEYYISRAEHKLTRNVLPDVRSLIPDIRGIIELGSGSHQRTEILLNTFNKLTYYIPVDVAREALKASALKLRIKYPDLEIQPLQLDYTNSSLPTLAPSSSEPFLIYYPGASVGNFEPKEAGSLLQSLAQVAGANGYILVGVDLLKDQVTVERAYNDRQGYVAAYNLNVLSNINMLANANFDITEFQHVAFWNPAANRVELHLRSLSHQTVTIDGHDFVLQQDELIHTGSSYKYSVRSFRELAKNNGLAAVESWVDDQSLFSLHLLKPFSS